MKCYWTRTLVASCLGVLGSCWASAQVCAVTNANINGPYGFVATQPGPVPATSTGTSTSGSTGTTGSTGSTGTTGTSGSTGSAGTTGATGTTSGTGTSGSTGTSSTGTYSNTSLGQLLSGISGGTQLALSGILTFDGAGNVLASSTPGGNVLQVGTFNVNPDCTITLNLVDAFGSSNASTALGGVVLGRGAEMDLTVTTSSGPNTGSGNTGSGNTGSGSGSTGSGTSSPGTSGSGSGSPGTTSAQSTSQLALKLTRVLNRNGCTDATLNGPYGFVLNAVGVQTPATSTGTGTGTGTGMTGNTGGSSPSTAAAQPTILGEVAFDGAGNIVMPASAPIPSSTPFSASGTSSSSAALPTSLTSLEYTGTYSVNADCSGTMTISSSSAALTPGSSGSSGTGTTTSGSGGSSTAESLTVSFVIAAAATSGAPGVASVNQFVQSPELTLTFSDPSQTGWGYAIAQ